MNVIEERQKKADDMRLANLQAKLKMLQSMKFQDEAQRQEAIARCQAGIDQMKNASASSNKEE